MKYSALREETTTWYTFLFLLLASYFNILFKFCVYYAINYAARVYNNIKNDFIC